MTLHPRHTTAVVSAIALIAALSVPAFAQDAMSSDAMSAMSGDAMMSSDAMAAPMASDAMMTDDMAMANDSMGMGDAMMGSGKTIMITIENVLTGQPFSPSFFEARTTDFAPLFKLGDMPGAIRWLERAVELEPRNSVINDHLGDVYWAAGRRNEARFQWERALRTGPEAADIPKIEAKLRDGLPTPPAATAQKND